MSVRAWDQVVYWIGLAGTIGFVVAGAWILVSRVWGVSFTMTLEVFVAVPFVTAWILSPLVWAVRPDDEYEPRERNEVISLVAAVLVVGAGAFAYSSDVLVLPLFYGVDFRTEALTALLAPAVQWGVLGVAAGAEWALRRSDESEQDA